MSVTTNEPTPEDRAEAAARDLADTGSAVTARAIREAASVRMAVAAAAARAWKEAVADEQPETIPDVPADVRGRLEAIWADAYRAARADITPDRDRLAREVEQLHTEVTGLTADVEAVEGERDTLAAEHGQTREALTAAETETHRLNETVKLRDATIAELREQVGKLEDTNNSLLDRITAIVDRLPAPATDPQ